jgi:transcriptional regulator with XRE-family HTH domain
MTPNELKARRERLNLSQAALAEAIKVRQHHLSRWETGSVPITEIRAAWLEQELRRLEARAS